MAVSGLGIMKVLVVDDVRFFRYYLERLLVQHGHAVLQAASGAEALETLRNEPDIDVVITDLIMPAMDGFELFRAARKIRRPCDERGDLLPRFILITTLGPNAYENGGIVQQAQELGFADVLAKPLDNERVIEHLEAAVRN